MTTKFANGIDLQGAQGVNFGAPTNPADAVNKTYADNTFAPKASPEFTGTPTVDNYPVFSGNTVTDFNNLIINSALDSDAEGYTGFTSLEPAASATIPAGCPTRNAIWVACPTGSGQVRDLSYAGGKNYFSCQPGDEFVFEALIACSAGLTASQITPSFRYYNLDRTTNVGTSAAYYLPDVPPVLNAPFGTEYRKITGYFRIPAGRFWFRPYIRLTSNSATPVGGIATTRWSVRKTADLGTISPTIMAAVRSHTLIGGGTCSSTAAGEVKWTEQFKQTANGRGQFWGASGAYHITMPAVGTVIPEYIDSAITSVTVTAGGIPLNANSALYAIPEINGGLAAYSLAVVSNGVSGVVVPTHWIPIVRRNSDGTVVYHWSNGLRTFPGTSASIYKDVLTEDNLSAAPVTPTGATVSPTLGDYFRRSMTALDFGAIPDGAIISAGKATGTDNGPALRAYSEWCRDNNQTFILPNAGTGYYRTTQTVIVWTDAEFGGTLLCPNQAELGNAIEVQPMPADVETIPLNTVQAWTNTVRGSRKINGLTGFAGKYVAVSTTSQDLIGRRGNPALSMGQGFFVTSNTGHISSELYANWTNSTWATGTFTAKRIRPRLTVTSPKVIFYYNEAWVLSYPLHQSGVAYAKGARIREGKTVWQCLNAHTSGATRNDDWGPASAGCGITVFRPHTDVYSTFLDNVGGSYLPIGMYVQTACSVRFFGWSVSNLYVLSDNYGFNCDLSTDIELYGGSTYNVRRAIDAHKSTHIRVFGGEFPDGVGAHYAWDMTFSHCNLGAYTGENSQVANIAGGNYSFINCTIYAHDLCSAAIRQRADIFELGGTVRIENNHISFAPGIQQTNTVFEIQGPSTGYDYGRDTLMPTNITITGNTIDVMDATAVVRPVSMFTRWTTAQFPKKIIAEGKIYLKNNVWNINGGVRPGGTGDPRIKFYYYKPDEYDGAGYDIFVEDVPGFWFEAMCNSTKATDPGMRCKLFVSNCEGDLFLRYANGAFKKYQWDRVGGSVIQNVVSAGSAFAPIGDEYRGPLFAFEQVNSVAVTTLPVRFLSVSVTTLLAQNATTLNSCVFAVNNRNNRLAIASGGSWYWMDGTPVS